MHPTELLKAQVFCIHESKKVIIIDKHKNFMLAALLVVSLDLNGFNNSQKFTVISFISRFKLKNVILASEF